MPNPSINSTPRTGSAPERRGSDETRPHGASRQQGHSQSAGASQPGLPLLDSFAVSAHVVTTTQDQVSEIRSSLRPGHHALTLPPGMTPSAIARVAAHEASRVREARYGRLTLPASAQATDLSAYLAGAALIRVLLCGECEQEAVVAANTVQALRTLYAGTINLVYQRTQAAHLQAVMPEFDAAVAGVQRTGNTVIQCASEAELEPAFLAITTDHINGEIEIPAASRVTVRFDIHRPEPDRVCDLLRMAGATYRLSGAPDADLFTVTQAARRADVLSRVLQLIAQKIPSPRIE